MFTSGDRASWVNAVAAKIMDGGSSPPSIELLQITVPPGIVTRENDGHCTVAAALGEKMRNDYQAGWRIIIGEMVTLLREQGFVGGTDSALTWLKPVDGTWKAAMDDGRQLTVFGQRERRMSRDRGMVGERDEVDGSRVGVPSAFESGRIHPLELSVIGARGGITQQAFDLHPLALAIPPMTERERETLRSSIEKDGVKVPIVIFDKKVLDGRNRAYFASVLKRPVHLEYFKGTEEEARRHVAILNLHRRHLSSGQLIATAVKLFGEETKAETTEAMEKGRSYGQKGKPNSPLKTAESSEKDRSGEWANIVARKAREVGMNVTAAGVRAMKEVMDAPNTLALVESGVIRKVSDANRLAREEKGMPKATTFMGVNHRSIINHLGVCITNLNAILTDLEMPIGSMPPEVISARFREIARLNSEAEQALRDRKVI